MVVRTLAHFSIQIGTQLRHNTRLLRDIKNVQNIWEELWGRQLTALQVWTLGSLSSCPGFVTRQLCDLRQVTTDLWLKSYLRVMRAETEVPNDFQSLTQLLTWLLKCYNLPYEALIRELVSQRRKFSNTRLWTWKMCARRWRHTMKKRKHK